MKYQLSGFCLLTQYDVRNFFSSFLALQENQDKKLKGGEFTFTLLFNYQRTCCSL